MFHVEHISDLLQQWFAVRCQQRYSMNMQSPKE